MEASSQGKTRNCVSCGRAIAWDANVCQHCGHDFRQGAPGTVKKEKGMMPIAGGILIILPAMVYLWMGAVLATGGEALVDVTFGASNILTICGAVLIILGIIAILGGIFAIMRKYWGLALLGGIFVIPTILGLVGMILVAVSHKDFD
jgi:predicted nucleic acid-binding Zn ribbon protein